MDFNTQICTVLADREITHSSFRLYVALAAVLGSQSGGFAEIDVEGLKAAVPGVKGKPLGEGALRENLRELERLGLIEMAGRRWSKYRIHIRLGRTDPNPEAIQDLRRHFLVPEHLAWGPDSWRSPR